MFYSVSSRCFSSPMPPSPSHGFSVAPGFLVDGGARAPYREEFMTIEIAADECSRDPSCRGFTVSASLMQDDRLHWCRFFRHTALALSGDWITWLKVPVHAFAYEFSPSWLDVPTSPMHQARMSLCEAHRFCDAEPACAGFSLPRHPNSESGFVAFRVYYIHKRIISYEQANTDKYATLSPAWRRTSRRDSGRVNIVSTYTTALDRVARARVHNTTAQNTRAPPDAPSYLVAHDIVYSSPLSVPPAHKKGTRLRREFIGPRQHPCVPPP